MKNLIAKTEKELKLMTSTFFGNKNFKFHSTEIKSINEIKLSSTGCDITNNFVSYYSVEKQAMEILSAPFNIELK